MLRTLCSHRALRSEPAAWAGEPVRLRSGWFGSTAVGTERVRIGRTHDVRAAGQPRAGEVTW